MTGQAAIGLVIELEDMGRSRQDRDEAGGLHEHVDQPVAFAGEAEVVLLDDARPLEDVAPDHGVKGAGGGRAVRRLGALAQPFQLGDVRGVLQQPDHLALGVEDRRMGGAPEPLLQDRLAARRRARNGKAHQGQVVTLARVARLLQRSPHLPHVLRRLLAGAGIEGGEQGLADDGVARAVGDVEIGLVHAGDAQIGGQQDIGIGRGVERSRQIDRQVARFRQLLQDNCTPVRP